MPLGDSITLGGYGLGEHGEGGYRGPLHQLLQRSGTPMDFVGTMYDPPGNSPALHHEGHIGLRIDELTATLEEKLTVSEPDVILLLAGTNDLIQGCSIDSAAARMRTLLDRCQAIRPQAMLLLASLPPVWKDNAFRCDPTRIQALNERYRNLVVEMSAQRRPVVFVDLYHLVAWTRADFGADGLHPSAAGYDKMARVWYTSLRANSGKAAGW